MLEKLKNNLQAVCYEYPQLKIQFFLVKWETDFLRFYQTETNYNISKSILELYVSVYKDQKNYSFYLANPTEDDFRERMEDALLVIDQLPPDPDFVDLEKDTRHGPEKIIKDNLHEMPLEKKINILQQFAEAIKPFHFSLYGTFICNYVTTYIVNTNGLDKIMVNSPFYFEVKAVSEINEITVLETFGGEDMDQFSLPDAINSLVDRVQVAAQDPIDVEAGEYEVILSPRCINELLQYYAWSNLDASSIDRQDTDLIGKIGHQVFPSYFTLHDAPCHPQVVNFAYGTNGHLYEELTLFESGILRNFFVDNYYAHKLGMLENGNLGACLVMKPGDREIMEMFKGIKKGLYISSFHYINFINQRETSLTGLTRDGTFLIENEQITKVVHNLRFTEKITSVINNITAIENKTHSVPISGNYHTFTITSSAMPYVRVKNFHISSSTETV